MKSGKAVSVQLELVPQIVVAMASPTGRLVNSTMPNTDTPTRLIATHIPVPSRRNRTARNAHVRRICSMR